MPPRRTNRRARGAVAAVIPPTCLHCGRAGHVSDLCDRTEYLMTAPALTGTHCSNSRFGIKIG